MLISVYFKITTIGYVSKLYIQNRLLTKTSSKLFVTGHLTKQNNYAE